MPFYQRGFLYLVRKRVKSVLLLLIFLFVNSMILSTSMILHTTERTEAAMQEKAGAKVVCEITDTANRITDKEAETIQNLTAVISINRTGGQAAYLADFVPVTASDSTEPDNQKVQLISYDDMEADGPFSDQSYRLKEGKWISPETQYSAVIHAGFADANGIQIGDAISFETENGTNVGVEVIGTYLTGRESRQDSSTLAVYRMENQMYIDNAAYLDLSGDKGFDQVYAYTGEPELLDSLAEEIQGILQEKADITTSDTLYQQMKAPLTRIKRVVSLMRLLTFLAGTAIASLLLCMWMRGRQKEMAVLISMGEQKNIIFLQALLEAVVLFLIALLCSCMLGTLEAKQIQGFLLAAAETDVSLQVSLQFADIASLLGIGGAVVVVSVLISLLPVIRTNPKDILSRTEG